MPASPRHRIRRAGCACGLLLTALSGTALSVTACGEPREDRIPGPDLLDEVETEIVATVDIDDDGFAVEHLEVEPGQAIQLVNTSNEAVRVRGSTDGDILYDTGGLRPDESTLVVLEEPGRYTFEIDDREVPALQVGVEVTPRPDPETPATEAD
jgi:plastocyanin